MLIGFGVVSILLLGCLLFYLFRNAKLCGDEPVASSALFAILFTSGLDGGFILLPLLEFGQYSDNADYQFTNPLAIEMGFWGITAWAMYFVSTLYFLTIEPKLKLFELTWVRRLSAAVALITCAFTLSLFMQLMPNYLPKQLHNSSAVAIAVIVLIVIAALLISIKTTLMTWVSKVSVLLFLLFLGYLIYISNFQLGAIFNSAVLASDYLLHAHHFILPFNDYHEFYLAWWITWSIMLGQFVAKFVKNLKPLTLFFIMAIVPLLPSFLWFTVLYHVHLTEFKLSVEVKLMMLALGVAFVINSIDFMVNNYSQVFKLSLAHQSKIIFIFLNSSVILFFTFLFQNQWFFVQYAALLVISIIYLLLFSISSRKLKTVQLKKARELA